jgi:hypothetical protein
MALLGVETLYIQTARVTSENVVDEPDRLRALIDHAHKRGMAVVAWYLPTFEDPEVDYQRLMAAAALPVDGLSVNLESKAVTNLDERNRRMVALSKRVDAALAGEPLATVILNPFALDVLVPEAWPNFPWAAIDPFYEVWQPMVYVTYRDADDEHRDTYTYTKASVEHLRRIVGAEPIHPVTGIADRMTNDDIEGFKRAADETKVLGGGIYDWATSTDSMWTVIDDIGR